MQGPMLNELILLMFVMDVTRSESISTPGSRLKNVPDHGRNRAYDLCNARPMPTEQRGRMKFQNVESSSFNTNSNVITIVIIHHSFPDHDSNFKMNHLLSEHLYCFDSFKFSSFRLFLLSLRWIFIISRNCVILP